MFSLIITLIAILIVIALSLATVYYGGSSFSQGKSNAESAAVLNESQQLQAAFDVYRAQNGALPSGTAEAITAELLSSQTLTAVPSSQWKFENDHVIATNISDAACIAMNTKLGHESTEVPACSSLTSDVGLCCSEEVAS